MVRQYILLCAIIVLFCSCATKSKIPYIQHIDGRDEVDSLQAWLPHEHILVDFIGADLIEPETWNHEHIISVMTPYLDKLEIAGINYFVDATPNYLGRDVQLLQRITDSIGLKIITNTGLYGARGNKYIPKAAILKTSNALARSWINEFRHGIDKTSVKPGFIKIGVDAADTLDLFHQELVKAAGLTHLKTGLTIASHTGEAKGLWPQLKILKELGVSPSAFIWVHAQNEDDPNQYLRAAKAGCWISLDGLGWELDNHLKKIAFAKENGILDRILISHDAGWYDPQKNKQEIKPYNNIMNILIPTLRTNGFTQAEIDLLMAINPAKAFSIQVKKKTLHKH